MDNKKDAKVINISDHKKSKAKKEKIEKKKNDKNNSNQFYNSLNWGHGPGDGPTTNP